MNDAAVVIELDEQRDTFCAGEMLTGQYRVQLAQGVAARALEFSVLWHTDGKGDEDLAVHYFERFSSDEGGLIALDKPRRFSTELPLSPLSYDGVIVRIRWCVRVRLFLDRGRDVLAERPFRLGNVPSARAVLP